MENNRSRFCFETLSPLSDAIEQLQQPHRTAEKKVGATGQPELPYAQRFVLLRRMTLHGKQQSADRAQTGF